MIRSVGGGGVVAAAASPRGVVLPEPAVRRVAAGPAQLASDPRATAR